MMTMRIPMTRLIQNVIENRRSAIKLPFIAPRSTTLAASLNMLCKTALAGFLIMLLLPATGMTQGWYMHTINSHSIDAQAGRTLRLNYNYQMSHSRQLKITGIYVVDEFTENRDEIRANIYMLNLGLQYQLLNISQFFVNYSFGLGGDFVRARNQIDQKHEEWDLHFQSGIQGEMYFSGGNLAIVLDYDFIAMPFSKLYEFLHVPTAGLKIVF